MIKRSKMMIKIYINRFYKLTAKGYIYNRIDSYALSSPRHREAIITDMESALCDMIELHELTTREKRNYRLWTYVVSELKIWDTRQGE